MSAASILRLVYERPGQPTKVYAERAGLSESTAGKELRKLVEVGLIRRSDRKIGGAYVYSVTLDGVTQLRRG